MNTVGFGDRTDHIGRLALFLSFHNFQRRRVTANLFVGRPDSALRARGESPSNARPRLEEQQLSIRRTDRPGLPDLLAMALPCRAYAISAPTGFRVECGPLPVHQWSELRSLFPGRLP